MKMAHALENGFESAVIHFKFGWLYSNLFVKLM